MKFGKVLRQTTDSRMPQWREHMINYKALKQAIKKQSKEGTQGASTEQVAEAFTNLLDTHVETVNNFYMERIEEGVIILHALHQHGEQIRAGIAKPDLRAACQRSLVSFHFQLLVLQNYVALNFTAITKVLKKFEKKFEILIKDEYIGAIVELPFYRCDALGDLVEETERQFKTLEGLKQAADSAAAGAAAQQQQQQQQPQPGQPGQLGMMGQAQQQPPAPGAPNLPSQLMPPPPPILPKGMQAGIQAGGQQQPAAAMGRAASGKSPAAAPHVIAGSSPMAFS